MPLNSERTPVTPIMVQANTVEQLKDEGWETCVVSPPDSAFGPDFFDGQGGFFPTDAVIDSWEPPCPEGSGWILHHKGFLGDEGDFGAVWARRRV